MRKDADAKRAAQDGGPFHFRLALEALELDAMRLDRSVP
jgi:hypothetical protein